MFIVVNNSIDIRVKFCKTGRAKYISHLDLQRAMQRVLKRTKLPVWHTMGFNPHVYITFPLTLSLGYESNCEFMDFAIDYDIPLEQVEKQVRQAFPDCFEVISVKYPVHTNKEIRFAQYEINLSSSKLENVALMLEEYLNSDNVVITRKNKKKEIVTTNIANTFNVVDIEKDNSGIKLVIQLPAGTEKNVNPTHLIEGFISQTNADCEIVSIKRTKILCDNGEDFS